MELKKGISLKNKIAHVFTERVKNLKFVKKYTYFGTLY